MRLRVLAVGQKMPAWVNEGVQEYTRRMPRDFSVEWLDVPPAKRGTSSAEQYQEQEARPSCQGWANRGKWLPSMWRAEKSAPS